jgi:phosphoribosylformylglycinamidine synthase
MRARIVVRLRPGILDPQGTTIRRALEGLGFPEVRDMRVGKVLDLTLDETDAGRARQRLDEMCRKLLANPVLEDYTCEVVEGATAAWRPIGLWVGRSRIRGAIRGVTATSPRRRLHAIRRRDLPGHVE